MRDIKVDSYADSVSITLSDPAAQALLAWLPTIQTPITEGESYLKELREELTDALTDEN